MKNIANFASSVILAVCAASVSSFADGMPTGYTQDDAYLFAYFSDKGHGTAFAVPKKMVDALVGRYAATGE